MSLHQRPTLDISEVIEGMLIAYMHPTNGLDSVKMYKVGELKNFSGSRTIIIEPTYITHSYLQFNYEPETHNGNGFEHMKTDETKGRTSICREFPVGKTKIVEIYEDDMLWVKNLVQEELDESIEEVDYES